MCIRDRVREGKGDIEECLQVMAYSGAENELRFRAGLQLEALLRADIQKLLQGQDSFYSLSDWERLLPILQRNSKFISCEGMALLKSAVDSIRMTMYGQQTFKFIKNISQSGTLGSFVGGALANYLSVEEMSFGLPLGIRSHGWNLPMTVVDTVAGWFEGIGRFEKTKESNGFFGKMFGFLQDVVGDVLSVPSKMISSISPIYRRSDARNKEAFQNVREAISLSERLLSSNSPISSEDAKTLYSNLTYLHQIRPVLEQNGEKELADRIKKHFSKYEIFYELLSSTFSRTEITAILADIKAGKYRSGAEKEKVEGLLSYKLAQLVESYVYLMSLDPKNVKEKIRGPVETEKNRIANIFVQIEGEANLSSNVKSYINESNRLLDVIGKLRGQQFSSDWKTVLAIANEESDFSKLSEESSSALKSVGEVLFFSQRYATIKGYLSEWLEKQDKKEVSSAITKLSERLAGGVAEVVDGKKELEKLSADFYLLSTITFIFPEVAAKHKPPESVQKSIEKLYKELDVGLGDLKTEEKKAAFFDNFTIFSRLLIMAWGTPTILPQDKLQEWLSGKLPKATKTLFDLTKSLATKHTKKNITPTEDTLYQQLQSFWKDLYSNFGEAVLASLSTKEKDYIYSIIEGKDSSDQRA
ncbi:MAG: hypothetical protein N3G22_03380, partial [Candidatus Micrarchaeota archaeon]|nr:hypothetical protein [Candidatus Micrarchaeota archaeon]